MKINSLLESQTPSSAISNTTSSAPVFGRDDEHLDETTTSGSVATVASPVGGMQRRGKGSMLKGIKTSAKFPNSKAVKESVNPQNFDSDVDYYDAVKKQGQQQFSGDWDVYDEIASLENQIKYTKSAALAHTLYQKIEQLKQQAGIEDDEDEYEKEYDADIRARKGLEEAGFTDTIKRGVKNIKRGLQGWDKNLEGPGGEKLGDPKEIVRRNKSYSDDTTLQLAKRKELGFPFGGDSTTGEHTPRGLQRKVLDREIKRRGLSPEQGVAEEQVSEKSKSQAQFRTMAAVAHNPKFAKKVGISQKVGKEFHKADKKQDYKDLPKEVDEEKQRLDAKCWTGYKKQGTKMKGDTRVNNCVKVDEAEVSEDKLANDLYKDLQIFKKGADKDIGAKAKDKEISSKAKDKDIVKKTVKEGSEMKINDIITESSKPGLWANIHAKRERIKSGSGERMRKPGSKGAPSAQDFKDASKTDEAANPAQQAAIAIAMKKKGQKPQNENAEYDDEAGMADNNLATLERAVQGIDELIQSGDNLPEWCQEKIAVAKATLVNVWDYMKSEEEIQMAEAQFDMIEEMVESWAQKHNVDSDVIWEYLESIDDDGLLSLSEDWQKANKKDKTPGMSRKAVKAYRRENPGSKLQTAVTTKPSKLKKGSKASKRRKSFCARSNGQRKMHNIDCSKTPDKAICKARKRWNC